MALAKSQRVAPDVVGLNIKEKKLIVNSNLHRSGSFSFQTLAHLQSAARTDFRTNFLSREGSFSVADLGRDISTCMEQMLLPSFLLATFVVEGRICDWISDR